MTEDRDPQWKPTMPEVSWPVTKIQDQLLDGNKWPDEIVLRAWERNEKGERRIKAERKYVVVRVGTGAMTEDRGTSDD